MNGLYNKRGSLLHSAQAGFTHTPKSLVCGFTLVEVVLAILIIVAVVAAILGAYVGQITLNEHARNLSLAIHDANRVIEQMRQQTAGCAPSAPSIVPTGGGGANWNGWLGAAKSIQPDPINNELITVTCRSRDGAIQCAQGQMGTEWNAATAPATPNQDPMSITVAVCWRHRGRIIGECSIPGNVLTAGPDGTNGGTAGDNIISSPAMLTTLVTCRG